MMNAIVTPAPKEQRYGWLLLFAHLVFLPGILSEVVRILQFPLTSSQLNILFFCVNFLLTVLVFRSFLLKSGQFALERPFFVLRSAVYALALYYLASNLLTLVIGAVAPGFVNANDSTILALSQQHPVGIYCCVVLLVPVTEECLYRGVLFGSLRPRSRILAYLLSSALFSLIHMGSFFGNCTPLQLLLAFVQYLPAGLTLAWAYDRSGSIWASILMHMTINQISFSILR